MEEQALQHGIDQLGLVGAVARAARDVRRPRARPACRGGSGQAGEARGRLPASSALRQASSAARRPASSPPEWVMPPSQSARGRRSSGASKASSGSKSRGPGGDARLDGGGAHPNLTRAAASCSTGGGARPAAASRGSDSKPARAVAGAFGERRQRCIHRGKAGTGGGHEGRISPQRVVRPGFERGTLRVEFSTIPDHTREHVVELGGARADVQAAVAPHARVAHAQRCRPALGVADRTGEFARLLPLAGSIAGEAQPARLVVVEVLGLALGRRAAPRRPPPPG